MLRTLKSGKKIGETRHPLLIRRSSLSVPGRLAVILCYSATHELKIMRNTLTADWEPSDLDQWHLRVRHHPVSQFERRIRIGDIEM